MKQQDIDTLGKAREHLTTALDVIRKRRLITPGLGAIEHEVMMALSVLEGMGRGQQEGETIVELVPNNYDCMLTCSKCGDGVPYYLLEEFDQMNYCPNCGCKINKAPHGKLPDPPTS